MSGFFGADTDQLRDHTQLLRDRARSLTELRDRLQPAILDESIWRGPDAEDFRSTWSSRTSPLFDEIAARIEGRGSDLDAHAEEQDTASGVGGADGGADGGGADGGGADGSWWDGIRQGMQDLWGGIGVFNTFQGLFSRGKKIWDLMGLRRTALELLQGADGIGGVIGTLVGYGDEVAKSVFSTGTEFSSLAAKLLGKLGVPTGIGNSKFFGWVDDAAAWASNSMPFLDDITPFLGKLGPGLDIVFGGAQMIDGIRNGDTFSAVTGGAGALGGGLMLAGGALSATGVGAVVGGPLALAGAVISGGAALADVGRMVYENWDSISSTAADAWNGAGDVISNVWDGAGDAISDGWDGLAGAFGF
jgi:hypothetical protein